MDVSQNGHGRAPKRRWTCPKMDVDVPQSLQPGRPQHAAGGRHRQPMHPTRSAVGAPSAARVARGRCARDDAADYCCAGTREEDGDWVEMEFTARDRRRPPSAMEMFRHGEEDVTLRRGRCGTDHWVTVQDLIFWQSFPPPLRATQACAQG
eukprot:Polyplicarium_translucidae@DN1116_c0_g1_i1.p2